MKCKCLPVVVFSKAGTWSRHSRLVLYRWLQV
uniref:Uncharacterized protein n=1 Tax=Anguilla anguilla TaxID=7936 RepID=A0A0E9PFI4_ANGAN